MKCPKCNAENENWAVNCGKCFAPMKSPDTEVLSAGGPGRKKREPGLALVLSLLFVGLGQAYNGQRKKAYFFYLGYLTLPLFFLVFPAIIGPAYFPLVLPLAVSTTLIIWVFNMVDAWRSAGKINSGKLEVSVTSGKSVFIYLRNIFLWALLFSAIIALVVFLFGPALIKKAKSVLDSAGRKGANQIVFSLPDAKNNSAQAPIKLESLEPVVSPAKNCTVEGIMTSPGGSLVLINGNAYRLNDTVCSGVIIAIDTDKVSLRLPEGEKSFRVNETITLGQ